MRKHIFSFLLSLLLIAPLITISQSSNTVAKPLIVLKGSIVDQKTKLGLSYVSIGIVNKPIGTLSDSLGNFSFEIAEENLNDTLQISLVGYSTQRMLARDFQNTKDGKIIMQISYTSLQEVIVTNHTNETEIIGRQKSGKLIQVSLHNRKSAEETIGSEMGIRVSNKHENAFLKDINWHFSANNFRRIKIRVNIYSMKNDMPDTLVTNKQLIYTVEDFKTGWIKFDLEPYEIQAPSDFLISIQWLEGKQDKVERPITIVPVATSFSQKCYVRIASQDKWKRMGMNPSCYVTLMY